MAKYLRLVIILVVIALPGWFLSKGGEFNGQDKLNIVVRESEEQVFVLSLNPSYSEIIKINLPSDSLVELSRNLGVMKVKNVWQLGQNEKTEGRLLAETVTKNYHLPTYLWADSPAVGFWSGNVKHILKAIFGRYQTNLAFKDRLKIGCFVLGVKDYKKSEIEIATVSRQKRLLLASDERLTTTLPKIKITDASGQYGLAEELGQIIESFGAKVALIQAVEVEDIDCTLMAKSKEVALLLSKVFACRLSDQELEGGFDLEIILGQQFAGRL